MYFDPLGPTIKLDFPRMDGSSIDQILNFYNTQVQSLTITLFWNAQEDIDLSFECYDGVIINYDNMLEPNMCDA